MIVVRPGGTVLYSKRAYQGAMTSHNWAVAIARVLLAVHLDFTSHAHGQSFADFHAPEQTHRGLSKSSCTCCAKREVLASVRPVALSHSGNLAAQRLTSASQTRHVISCWK